jgi:hypothetical protein
VINAEIDSYVEDNNTLKEKSRVYEEIKMAHSRRRESVRNETQGRLQHYLKALNKVEESVKESSASVLMLGKKVKIR